MSERERFWASLKEDFRQDVKHSSYRGQFRKTFHTLTGTGFQAVFFYRVTRWLHRYRIPVIGMILQRISELWTGVSISPKAKIGPGLVIFHFGQIFVNGAVEMGDHCRLHHDVTIGNKNPGGACPKIGSRVMIGAGARLLGGIRVGDDVEIGANAVVIGDLPDRAVAVGIPARVVRTKSHHGGSER